MRNFFNNLKLTFSASARNELVNATLQQDNAADKATAAAQKTQRTIQGQETAPKVTMVGHVSTETLLDMASDYGRNAISSLGSWSALARGFSEFVKNPKSELVSSIVDEFHAWNAAAVENKQMDDQATLDVIARLSQVNPAKGNAQTDAIIARVTKKSVEDIKQDRIAKAEIKTKQREEAMLAFNSLLWASISGSGLAEMPAQKAYDKLEQTLLWIAGWDSSNPAAQAAELLLIEADMKLVGHIGKQAPGAEEDFVEGVMCADTLTRKFG